MKTLFYAILFLVSMCGMGFGSEFEMHDLHVRWTYDPPPDLKVYEMRCTPDENDTTIIPLDEVRPYNGPEVDIEGGPQWQWKGRIKVTSGKFECYLQAVDLAGQKSGWSEPGYFDPKPPKIIHLIISSPDAVVNIQTN